MSETTDTTQRESIGEEALERARERLNDIWSAWGLALDTATSTTQMGALKDVMAWLARGEQEPFRVVRAVQYLLCDPERPGAHKRPAWAPLKRTVLGKWGSVANQAADVRLLQALLLAAWRDLPVRGGFRRAELLSSAWDARMAREPEEQAAIQEVWSSWVVDEPPAPTTPSARPQKNTLTKNGYDWSKVDQSLAKLQEQITVGHGVQTWAQSLLPLQQEQLAAMKKVELDHRTALLTLSSQLVTQLDEMRNAAEEVRSAPLLQLLWWGQARYSRTLRRPYRRFPEKSDIPFWAAWEASQIAFDAKVEVEPAAAYLVEVLHSLGLDVEEKKPLREWMIELHASLARADDNVHSVCPALTKLASEDALGMPVTWVRLQSSARRGLEGAEDAVALDLGAPIDRGQWAAWIFREALLDRHSAGDPA
jgi:hypothetical protein